MWKKFHGNIKNICNYRQSLLWKFSKYSIFVFLIVFFLIRISPHYDDKLETPFRKLKLLKNCFRDSKSQKLLRFISFSNKMVWMWMSMKINLTEYCKRIYYLHETKTANSSFKSNSVKLKLNVVINWIFITITKV